MLGTYWMQLEQDVMVRWRHRFCFAKYNCLFLAACPAGTYWSATNLEMCLPCPMNTVTTAIGTIVCECVNGYFRDVQTNEGPEVDCTCMSEKQLSLVLP